MIRFIENIFGSEMIPIRLIISISVIGFISFLVVQGLTMSYHVINEDEFSQSLTRLQKNVETIVNIGHPRDVSDVFSLKGTTHVHSLYVPSEIMSVSFGSDINVNSSELKIKNLSKIVYSSMNAGDHVLWCDNSCQFIRGIFNDGRWLPSWNDSRFTIKEQGQYMITFELVTDGSSLFILVYDESNVNL
ncbi:hypothetical protein B6U98_02510 [Thermoplasmatales archaeon ex4572_165]|nr:MAG: hypothetical protein B6U98_02510 [Thermoplasmatales archaeon ex4572_165]